MVVNSGLIYRSISMLGSSSGCLMVLPSTWHPIRQPSSMPLGRASGPCSRRSRLNLSMNDALTHNNVDDLLLPAEQSCCQRRTDRENGNQHAGFEEQRSPRFTKPKPPQESNCIRKREIF